MTVQDALERAKRMAQARRREDSGAAGAAAPYRANDRLPVPPAPVPQPAAYAPTEQRKQELPTFEFTPYDVDQCIRSRVLVPEMRSQGESQGAAAYRILRARLLQKIRGGKWVTVGLTSPGPSEGKSLTALNLALTIAAEGNNDVFLLDLDLRNPSVARYLGVAPSHSIADCLAGKCGPQDALFSVGIANLTLGTSAANNSQASELLASGRLFELLAYIREVSTRPLIMIDMPPVLNTDDALVLAPQVDAMLMVVGEGRTRRDGLNRATELLSDFNLAGIVLNHSRETVQDYYVGNYGAG
jgi:protein-tyrosine kinase